MDPARSPGSGATRCRPDGRAQLEEPDDLDGGQSRRTVGHELRVRGPDPLGSAAIDAAGLPHSKGMKSSRDDGRALAVDAAGAQTDRGDVPALRSNGGCLSADSLRRRGRCGWLPQSDRLEMWRSRRAEQTIQTTSSCFAKPAALCRERPVRPLSWRGAGKRGPGNYNTHVMSKRPDYGNATPEDLARALMRTRSVRRKEARSRQSGRGT